MPLVDTDVFLLHVYKYEVGDSTPGCMSHRFIRAVFIQRWTDPRSIDDIKLCTATMDLGSGLTDGNVLARNSQPAWSIERYYEEN